MTLGQKQRVFTLAVAQLIEHAYELGYEVSLGDAYRDPRVFGNHGNRRKGAYGRKTSLHKLRLAIDLNLFRDGEYLAETADHAKLGLWWQENDELAVWGGDWNDGNHYSFSHNGCR